MMRKLWMLILLAIPTGLHAQQPVKQAAYVAPARRDPAKLPEPAQPIYFSAASANEWLKRASKPDGSFVYGFQPSLRVLIDGDNFISQAGAVHALARASRYLRDDAGTVKAQQAILTLLLQTMPDPQNPTIRYTAAPPGVVNRLASNGLLVSAIHELAKPQDCKDLLDRADELCNFLREQQRADGSLFLSQGKELIRSASAHVDVECAGLALQGIIRSHKLYAPPPGSSMFCARARTILLPRRGMPRRATSWRSAIRPRMQKHICRRRTPVSRRRSSP